MARRVKEEQNNWDRLSIEKPEPQKEKGSQGKKQLY